MIKLFKFTSFMNNSLILVGFCSLIASPVIAVDNQPEVKKFCKYDCAIFEVNNTNLSVYTATSAATIKTVGNSILSNSYKNFGIKIENYNSNRLFLTMLPKRITFHIFQMSIASSLDDFTASNSGYGVNSLLYFNEQFSFGAQIINLQKSLKIGHIQSEKTLNMELIAQYTVKSDANIYLELSYIASISQLSAFGNRFSISLGLDIF